MWPTLLTKWRTRFGKYLQKGKPRRHSAGCRPRLEVLEDRTAPAALGYSTYLGGPVEAVAVQPGDTTGAVYLASGSSVLKLNNGGTGLVYGTNVGGGTLYALAVDAAGDAYVYGQGGSVPTTPNAIASSGIMFVAELNPSGNLVYATYLPGADGFTDTKGFAGAIAVDGSGNIYVTGGAVAGFPVTPGAYQTAYLGGGLTNAFFAKINPALSGSASLVYATYLGGSGNSGYVGDAGTGIALDGSGNAYVTGYTGSSNLPSVFPTTPGAYQTSFVGWEDAFVAKINPSLSGGPSLVYSTLLGGSGTAGITGTGSTGYFPDINHLTAPNEIDGGIAVDSAGNAYVTSTTSSLSFPTTTGAFQTQSNLNQTSGGGRAPTDAFVTKLNATGTGLVYSTYLGGGANTHSGGAAIALDANGDAYVTGWTTSTVFPTKNPIQAANGTGGVVNSGGETNSFVTVLSPSGAGLVFSTYLGGSYADFGYGIALDSAGNAYVGGQTQSSNFPTTPGAYQTTYLVLWDQDRSQVSRTRVSTTLWKIDACPMTYYSISRNEGGFLAVWPTRSQIYYARLDSKGNVLPPGEIRTPGKAGMRTGILGLSAPDGSTLIAWRQDDCVKWQLYDAIGQPSGSVGSEKSAGTSVAGVVDKSGHFILFR
jgi:hypothetical protein